MIFGVGTDFVEVKRIAQSIDQYGEVFLNRIFTQQEQIFCEKNASRRYLHYAARFAFKEALSKAIGTGVANGFEFRLCELVNMPNGKPMVQLHGILFERWNTFTFHVTMSHTDNHALAFVVVEAQH